jgi:hypothetical protein
MDRLMGSIGGLFVVSGAKNTAKPATDSAVKNQL